MINKTLKIGSVLIALGLSTLAAKAAYLSFDTDANYNSYLSTNVYTSSTTRIFTIIDATGNGQAFINIYGPTGTVINAYWFNANHQPQFVDGLPAGNYALNQWASAYGWGGSAHVHTEIRW